MVNTAKNEMADNQRRNWTFNDILAYALLGVSVIAAQKFVAWANLWRIQRSFTFENDRARIAKLRFTFPLSAKCYSAVFGSLCTSIAPLVFRFSTTTDVISFFSEIEGKRWVWYFRKFSFSIFEHFCCKRKYIP